MKAPLVLIALFLLTGQPCLGAQNRLDFRIPPGSPLTFDSTETLPSYLTFSGRANISVAYTFIYHSEAHKPFVELFVEPDPDALRMLPYLTERKKEELPEKILVSNTEEAAELLLGPEMTHGLLGGKYLSVHGHAVIVIGNFVAGYECDHPLFMTEVKGLLEVIQQAEVGAARQSDFC